MMKVITLIRYRKIFITASLIFAAGVITGGVVNAATINNNGVIFTVNSNKNNYIPGETIILNYSLTRGSYQYLLGTGVLSMTLDGATISSTYLDVNFTPSGTSYFTAPSTDGVYTIALVGCVDFAYADPTPEEIDRISFNTICSYGSINPITISPIPGTVSVSSNISSSWTITGPATITGSGTSQTSTSKPPGTYTITWGDVTGYTTPPSQSFTLVSSGTISFNGAYTALTCSNGAVNYPTCTTNSGGQCLNGADNPATCDTCAPGFTFFNNSCEACTNGAVNYPTCTVNSSNQCINGTNNPVGCTICPTGEEFVADICTAAAGYTPGDNNCDTLAGENFSNSPLDCKPKARFWTF